MARIFISHSSANNAEALAVQEWLVSHGWDDLFLDLDPERGLKAGERWQAALKQAAERCQLVIFLVSPAWATSKWCLAEFLLAANLNKRIFGVIVEPTPFADLPTELTAEWQLVDLTAGSRDHETTVTLPPGETTETVSFSHDALDRLRIGLMESGLDPKFFAWPPENDPRRAPYRGLRPLDADDAGIFFGRDGPIVLGLDMLRGIKEAAPPRLVVILGASGSGKSSFMRAGLLPRLARGHHRFLPLPVVRPERAVITGKNGFLASIEQALNGAGRARTRADIRTAINAGGAGLSPLLTELVETRTFVDNVDGSETRKRPILVLPIDQAEELFLTDGAEESGIFLGTLRDLTAEDAPALIALFTIRSDRYERLQTAKELEGLRQHFLSLPPMLQGSNAEVIKGPALRLDGSDRALEIEEPLVDRLLEDIEAGGAKDSLPLLAFTLERLYLEHGGDGHLALDDYQELGGIKGSIEAAVEQALKIADDNPAIPKERKARLVLLRRSLVPWLAGIDPDTGAPRRRVARLSEIPPESRPLIELFVEQRLLATDVSRETGEVTVEPAHEALLRQWGMLDGWLEEDFGDLATLEGVKRATRDWEANARHGEWLTHAGGRLEAAELVAAREDLAGILDPTERAYLEAARIRQQAEERRKRRLARLITWGSIAAALVMAVFGVVLYGQWQDRLRSESLFISDLAHEQIRNGDAVTGELLALEALKGSDSNSPAQILRPYVPAAQGALDAATSGGMWRDRVLAGHTSDVTSVAVASDGSRIVSGSADSTASVWDAAGRRTAELEGHTGLIWSVALAPDGLHVVTGSADATARLWDAATGELIHTFAGHVAQVYSVALTPDGSHIVTGSDDHTARLWDAATGALSVELEGHAGAVLGVAVTPDGARIVTASSDKTARVWDAATGAQLTVLAGHTLGLWSVAVTPDGSRIITGSNDTTARLWDAVSGELVRVLEDHESGVIGVAVTADGSQIVTVSTDNTVRLWNAVDGAPIALLRGHANTSVAVTADGSRIVTGSKDDTVRLWASDGGEPLAVLEGHTNGVWSAAFTPDGSRIITGAIDNTARLWDAATGTLVFELDHEKRVYSVAVTPDGARIVTGSSDNAARLWDAATGALVLELTGHSGPILSVAVTPDGSRIVTGSDDKTARLWDAASGTLVLELTGHAAAVTSVAVAPDGSRIVTGSWDKTARVWNAATGEPIVTLTGHDYGIWSVALTPDGSRIVTGCNDGTAQVWNAVTGAPIVTLTGHSGGIRSVAVTPDGSRIVTGSKDRTARLWDLTSGQQVAVLKGHQGWVTGVAVTPEGSRIVTASRDRTARLWAPPSPTQTLIQRSKESISRCLTGTQRKQFHLTSTPPRWCYELEKWPYHDPARTPLPPHWYVKPFVDVLRGVGG